MLLQLMVVGVLSAPASGPRIDPVGINTRMVAGSVGTADTVPRKRPTFPPNFVVERIALAIALVIVGAQRFTGWPPTLSFRSSPRNTRSDSACSRKSAPASHPTVSRPHTQPSRSDSVPSLP